MTHTYPLGGPMSGPTLLRMEVKTNQGRNGKAKDIGACHVGMQIHIWYFS